MSNPYLVTDYGQAFIYYTCDRDPTSSEPLIMTGYSNMLIFWWNTTTTNFFCCTNNATNGSLVWQEIAMPQNILSIINNAGWKINTNRTYSQRISPAFSTSYTPSSTNDTFVLPSLNFTSTILTAATVNFQVNSGTGFITVGQAGLSGLAATDTKMNSFIVPANSSYQLVQASGTSSIVSIYELSL